MAAAVYVLCALMGLACAVLLLRSYAGRRVRLLFWSGLGFVGFAIANAVLVADLVVFPERDLQLWRDLPTLAGVVVLVYGLIWDTQ